MERTYRIRVAAELSGVSEGLIRAWERRYGVLKPRRTASGYRSYTSADIEVLKQLKRLTEEGVAIAEAVKLLPQIRREVKEGREHPKPPKPGQLAKWRSDVLHAAESLDQQRIEQILEEAMARLRPVSFFDDLVMPLLREVGDRWHAGTLSVAQEHLVTQTARQCLLALIHRAPHQARHHVVCACFPKEDHELGLLGVALKFRHAGWRVTFLGARTPAEYVGQVVKAIHPDLVALSCVADEGTGPFEATLRAIVVTLPHSSRVVVGGAASLKYHSVAASLGVQTVTDDHEWNELLA